jgi:hypothetical protein
VGQRTLEAQVLAVDFGSASVIQSPNKLATEAAISTFCPEGANCAVVDVTVTVENVNDSPPVFLDPATATATLGNDQATRIFEASHDGANPVFKFHAEDATAIQ